MGQLCISIPDWPPGSDTASTPSPKILDELRRRACNTVQTLKRSRVTPQGLGVPNQVQGSAGIRLRKSSKRAATCERALTVRSKGVG